MRRDRTDAGQGSGSRARTLGQPHAATTAALVERYPESGMLIAAQIGPKVAKGEMTWG
jgi:hypothetical protein